MQIALLKARLKDTIPSTVWLSSKAHRKKKRGITKNWAGGELLLPSDAHKTTIALNPGVGSTGLYETLEEKGNEWE